MTNEVKNVPEIRFPKFDDEWKEKKFYECVEIEGKLVNPNFHEYQNLPHIGPGNIQKNTGRILNYNLVKDENLISGKFEFDEKDIIYGKINPQLQKICIPGFRGLASADTYPIKTISGVSNTYFIYYSLFTSRFFKYSVSVSMRTGMPKINKEELGSYNFYLPKIMEQQKIGEFFSKLDRQIELEEQKLAKLEEQKKGYMQKIFSQEIRFKDENGNDYPDWKEQKLEELGRFNSGVGFPEKYQGGNLGTPFFKVSDMNLPTNKTFMNMANNYVTDQQINEKKWKVINDVPAVIFAKVGAAIMLNRKRMVIEPFLMDNNTMSYSFSNHWDTNFGNIFFQTLNLPKYAQVGALPSYNSKDIGTISVNLPSLSEQKKIGDFFSKLDSFIEKQSAKVELLKKRKQGLLQKMFV